MHKAVTSTSVLCLLSSWVTDWPGRASSPEYVCWDESINTCPPPFHVLQASNPLYRKPISTHSVDFTFNKFNKSYNGTVD